MTFENLTVIGAGAWGTALANLAAHNGLRVRLWAREEAVIDAINNERINRIYLDNVVLHKSLKATNVMAETAGSDAYLFVVPAQYAREVIGSVRAVAPDQSPVAICAKGIENGRNLLMTEVFAEVWPTAQLAVLSGPSFARDVANGLPTAVTLACADHVLGQQWADAIGARHFRPYLTSDLVGVEIGGAMKNVLAIAAGAVDGRGLGQSARAAVIARGFAECQRLGAALGAKPETLAGLSGLGDLILTATSTQSRNMSLGRALGEGKSLDQVLGERRSVSEGVATAKSIVALGEKAGVDLPICQAVAALVAGEKSIDALIESLLSRPFKAER